MIRGRPIKYYLSKLPKEILQSSVFLAANCFYFLGFFCLARFVFFYFQYQKYFQILFIFYFFRKFFGNINYWGNLLFNIPACFLSIIIERKQRRGLLALYLSNLVSF